MKYLKNKAVLAILAALAACSHLPDRQRHKSNCIETYIDKGLSGKGSEAVCRYIMKRD